MLAFLTLHPTPARPDSPAPDTAAQLQAAETAARVHGEAALQAVRRAREEAARAALLAEQQVTSAMQLRRLEDRTAQAADDLARLQAEATAAAATLRANQTRLTALLPIMQRLSAAPAAILLATPESATDSVRGILILQGVAAAIEQRSEQVKAEAQSVASLLVQIAAQQKLLLASVAAERSAEDALTAQIAAADKAETADADIAAIEAAKAAKANASIQDLQGMVTALQPGQQDAAAPPDPFGPFAPVAGSVVESYGDPTVAGPAQGVTYKAAPGARVVAPCAGPVLFADQFKSYGLLVILGCGANTDFVLSGMHHLDVSSGQRLARGQPLGEMMGFDPKNPAAEPRLYVEYLQNGAPANPAAWIAAGGSG